MIMVRDEFHCEPGRAQAFVDRFKAMANNMREQDVIKRGRIMTDLSGSFDTVVVETEIESIDAYQAFMRAAFADPESQAAQVADGNRLYRSGTRTFYTLEAEFER